MRGKAVDDKPVQLPVFVPAPDAPVRASILPGSGIVGTFEHGRLLCDYEGNRYGSPELSRYADRVFHAFGRHVEHYPTVARVWVAPEQMIEVGWFDRRTGRVELHDDPARQLLSGWLGVESVDPAELQHGR